MRRRWGCAVLVVSLAGCAGDPRDVGITGPHPDGVQAVTLSQTRARADVSEDNPGISGATLDRFQYVPQLAPRSSLGGVAGQRYFGYNY